MEAIRRRSSDDVGTAAAAVATPERKPAPPAAAEEEAPISMAGMAGGLAAMMANAKTADADAESRQSGWSDDDSVFGKAFVS